MLVIEGFDAFWRRSPALQYAAFILLGCYASLAPNLFLFVPLFILGLPLLLRPALVKAPLGKRLLLSFALFCMTLFFIRETYTFPIPSDEGTEGSGVFEISSLSSTQLHLGKMWIYKGTLTSFKSKENPQKIIAHNIPCRVVLHHDKNITRPSADCSYVLQGSLQEISKGSFRLIVRKETPWLKIKGSWSLAEKRFAAKKSVSTFIHQHIRNPRSAAFLSGIATGDFDDRLMSFEFGRFGLQHIMAISGFHFAIIASILSAIFSLIFPKKHAVGVLIFALSGYFLFLGCAPSIMRAWISSLIILMGMLLDRPSCGLNALGMALMVILLFDPLLCLHIGLQFSFATTLAILMLYSGCDLLLQKIFKRRSLGTAVMMDAWNRHGYVALTALRQAIALTLAVNLAAMPMMLCLFQKFPWLSLLYNLFFPFLVSLSMLLLILAILTGAICSFAGDLLHSVNNHYTSFVLDFTYNLPSTMDYIFRPDWVTPEIIICYLSLLFCLGVWTRHHVERQQQDAQDFLFV